jgi:hypothetical protein
MRVYAVTAAALVGLGFAVMISTTAPAITLGEPDVPCRIAGNQSYIDTYCHPTTETSGPPMVCDGAPVYEYYDSAYDACVALRRLTPLRTKAYATLFAWANLMGILLISTKWYAAGEGRPRLPKVHIFAKLLLTTVLSVCLPLYIGCMLTNDLHGEGIVTRGIDSFIVPGLNLAVVAFGLLLINLENILRRLDTLFTGKDMDITVHGRTVKMRDEMEKLVPLTIEASAAAEARAAGDDEASAPPSKFGGAAKDLITGRPAEAALGVNHYMKVSATAALPTVAEGVKAIEEEFERSGNDEDLDNLDYILHKAAGSSDKAFPNGNLRRDCDSDGKLLPERRTADNTAMTFRDFCEHPASKIAHLHPAHVLALRLYTTSSFQALNQPLRNMSEHRPPHPFPATINFLKEGILRLRANGAGGPEATASIDLYRGFKDMRIIDNFKQTGGTELAPMSTTTDLNVAIAYALSKHSLVMKLRTRSFMQRGADIAFLSAFPGEKEILFAPLTYLRPTGRSMALTFPEHAMNVTVIEVEPVQ